MSRKLDPRAELGRRLKEERDRLGISQTAMAALDMASKNSQIAWEKGTAMPKALYLTAIGAAGVDVLYVLSGLRMPEQLREHFARASRATLAAEGNAADLERLAHLNIEAIQASEVVEPAPGKTGDVARLDNVQAPALTPRETELLRHYRGASDRDRRLIDGVALHIAEREARLASEAGPVSRPVVLRRRRRDDRGNEGTGT